MMLGAELHNFRQKPIDFTCTLQVEVENNLFLFARFEFVLQFSVKLIYKSRFIFV